MNEPFIADGTRENKAHTYCNERVQALAAERDKLLLQIGELEGLLKRNEGRVKEIVDEKLMRERDDALRLIDEIRGIVGSSDADGDALSRVAMILREPLKRKDATTADTLKEQMKFCDHAWTGEDENTVCKYCGMFFYLRPQ